MAIQIEQIETPSAPDALLRELARYYVVVEAEDMPGDPPTPFAMRLADWRQNLDFYPVKRWALREDGQMSAVGVVAYDLEQNLENGTFRVHVHPEKRGRGYARAIAGPMFDELEAAGRHRVDTWVKKGEPAESLMARLGLKSVYVDKRSRLTIADLDHELMRSWVERSQERADDYELIYQTVPFPDEMIDKFCEMTLIMNTAPREDVEEEDEVLTPEMWRKLEATVIASQCQLHTVIAAHRPTGAYVGYTQIKTQDLQPDLAWNWDTGVDPGHRNRGLGRWLKASMIERIVSEYPDVERVDTFNAGSNEPMLNINEAMGFRPVHLSNVWQGPLATVREKLGA